MSNEKPPIGSCAWRDLTVADAPGLRDFYASVIGWSVSEVGMGDYADYAMGEPENNEPIAGVCHARGTNAGLPPVWLNYFVVESCQRAIDEATGRGGEVLDGPRGLSGGTFAVIRDPAGAVFAVWEA